MGKSKKCRFNNRPLPPPPLPPPPPPPPLMDPQHFPGPPPPGPCGHATESKLRHSKLLTYGTCSWDPPRPRNLWYPDHPTVYCPASPSLSPSETPNTTNSSNGTTQRTILKTLLFIASALCVVTVTPLPMIPLAAELSIPITSTPLKATLVVVYTITTTSLYHLLIGSNLKNNDKGKEKAGYNQPPLYILGGIVGGMCVALVLGVGRDLEGLLLVGVGWGILGGLGCLWARGVWRGDGEVGKVEERDWDDDITEA